MFDCCKNKKLYLIFSANYRILHFSWRLGLTGVAVRRPIVKENLGWLRYDACDLRRSSYRCTWMSNYESSSFIWKVSKDRKRWTCNYINHNYINLFKISSLPKTYHPTSCSTIAPGCKSAVFFFLGVLLAFSFLSGSGKNLGASCGFLPGVRGVLPGVRGFLGVAIGFEGGGSFDSGESGATSSPFFLSNSAWEMNLTFSFWIVEINSLTWIYETFFSPFRQLQHRVFGSIFRPPSSKFRH